MKIISMYLPQFHRVKENDEWWGDGFTDWVSAKNAEQLKKDHDQPHIPLNNYYYDLLDKQTMQWQAALMNQYGIDVQCFYHYWFKDGRRILEKPAENLLKWTDIDMPFCFCWANESWARTWSRLGDVNVWMKSSEQEHGKMDANLLLEQVYGQEEQWRQHFEYLLPFFMDKRYLKIDGKPVFLFYKTSRIFCLEQMAQKWNEWALESDFAGVYLIGANSNYRTSAYIDAVLQHEPQRTLEMYREKGRPLFLKYDDIWKSLLSYRDYRDKVFYGGFVGYDDSPRRGAEGTIIEGTTPEKFRIYFSKLIAKNIACGNDLVFLNAWNEWGEGMYLEPDEKYKYGYLEAVQYAKEHYIEYLNEYQKVGTEEIAALKKELDFWMSKCSRYEGYWRALDAWLLLKEDGISVSNLLKVKGISRIAIYGMGMLGKHLLSELEGSDIHIDYLVDKTRKIFRINLETYTPNENFPQTDAIIATRDYEFSAVKLSLEKKGHKKVISLEQLLLDAVQ